MKNDSCCEKACCDKKTGGVNTSMTVGVGTDGIRVGKDDFEPAYN